MNHNKNKLAKKILLIEDDELTIETIKFVLEKEGYIVSVAKDGEQALDMLKQKVDLILLDLVMPELSGFEILKIIRQEKHLQVPVIVFSNLGKDEDVKRGLELGADDYLIKSQLSIQAILKKIKAVLP